MSKQVIEINSTVLVRFSSGETLSFTIVPPQRINPSRGFISCDSPLGKALLGKEKGDKMSYSVGDRTFYGDILEISLEANAL